MADSGDTGDLGRSRMARVDSCTMSVACCGYCATTGISWPTDIIVVSHRVFREAGEYAVRSSGVAGNPGAHELHLRCSQYRWNLKKGMKEKRRTYHLSLDRRPWIMEIGMEQALQTSFHDLVCVILHMVPSMNDELDSVDDDDLCEISSGFVDCKAWLASIFYKPSTLSHSRIKFYKRNSQSIQLSTNKGGRGRRRGGGRHVRNDPCSTWSVSDQKLEDHGTPRTDPIYR